MCTAVSLVAERHLFGRTLDVERTYGEQVVITPRDYGFSFLHEPPVAAHAALLGVAVVHEGMPLYFDAMNESGLCMAGLNFKSAVYHAPIKGKRNVTSFELIPWVLTQCSTLAEARALLGEVQITKESISPALPATPLHWIVADESGAIVVESTGTGSEIRENTERVLANDPPFGEQAAQLAARAPVLGVNGAIRGITGDLSSPSRFVRAAFFSQHADVVGHTAGGEIGGFFHVMDTVGVPLGCVRRENGDKAYTAYTSCTDAANGAYYFTTYGCRRIRAVHLAPDARDACALTVYPMSHDEDIQRVQGDRDGAK